MFYDIYVLLCKEIGKKPSAVAQELGINKSNVTNWKNNGCTPRGATLTKIADYFGVSIDFLLDNERKNSISKQNHVAIKFPDNCKKNEPLMLSVRLKELRKEFDYTQEDIAKKIGITKSAYGYYEQEKTIPDAYTLEKLADIFNVSTDYLLGHDTENIQLPLSTKNGNAIIQQALKDTGLLDKNGELSEEGGKIIADFIRSNATVLKAMLQMSHQKRKVTTNEQ